MTTMTAESRRKQAKKDYNAFIATCPTRLVLATIGDKWAALAVNALAAGPLRNGELMSIINGASQKMLTQTLRTLERDGIVRRTVTAAVPVRVDYELTSLGQTLLAILTDLKRWSESNMDQILAARDEYDSRSA